MLRLPIDQCIQCLYSKINFRQLPTKSIKDINDPKKFSLSLGNKNIFRGNRTWNPPQNEWAKNSFAINCASFSCPNLLNEVYTEAKLNQQLAGGKVY
jgi:hypothetical protein